MWQYGGKIRGKMRMVTFISMVTRTSVQSCPLWLHHSGSRVDAPKVRQYSLQNRWFWKKGDYTCWFCRCWRKIAWWSRLPHAANESLSHWFSTDRYELIWNMPLFSIRNTTNIALMGVSMQTLQAQWAVWCQQKNAYASLMFEQTSPMTQSLCWFESPAMIAHRTWPPATADCLLIVVSTRSHVCESKQHQAHMFQYTYNLHNRFIAMAGLRVDHSVFTVRSSSSLPAKWVARVDLRLSAGKGYREVRTRTITSWLRADSSLISSIKGAWNYGAES